MENNKAGNSETTEQNSHRRGKGRPFVKGVSGNPSGRPKKTEEQRQAEEQQENALIMLRNGLPKAVQTVLNLLDDPATPANVKVKITELMLDRTYGKAFQQVQVDTDISSECGVVIMPMRGDHNAESNMEPST